ncbi:hypothetical protein LTR70_003666 [Exophiala xenobiotica]|uniref:NADH dehydrogenase (Ubiquinone) 1 beta subcomplex 8 n=1 Tax=Lithohypha guttulata TaxID=1690604 RepID=A0ABR0KFJ5_9EURO|nr:hypothetical protein LTR24_003143 [Lithohypha guttulata]KAK5322879.1 hypothetical protein LTR70_003666 [Exophiala xenobiotica]
MLSRQIARQASRLSKPALVPRQALRAPFSTTRSVQALSEAEDPEMNGGYINPPRIKRQFRDPYGDWTYKQERRNFGEPLHEDEDEMGVFSLEEYTVMSGRMGVAMWTFFLGCVGALSFGVYATYPDRPSAPRTFEGGLEAELGGPGAPRAFKEGDEVFGVELRNA